MLLFLDCETRSALTLQKVGVDRYSHNCELLMLAHAIDEEEPDIWLPSESRIPDELLDLLKDPTCVKIAWNCGFERAIFRNQLGIDTPIGEWLDPSVYARYMGLPSSLALASEYLKLGDTAKDKEGRRLIQKFSKPYKSRKTGTYSFRDWNDKKHNPDWQLFQQFVTSIISSQEWIRLRDAGSKQFPNEVLARGEILGRYAMSGVAALKNLSEQDRARLQHEHQATMCVAGPEGDKPRTSWD